jgi:hypothetical protein
LGPEVQAVPEDFEAAVAEFAQGGVVVAHVAADIRRRATTHGYNGPEREGADTCADCPTAKKSCLDYATALARIWPIVIGVIEGACRQLVKDRVDSAEAILKLRALTASGDFDDCWPFQLQQEHTSASTAPVSLGLSPVTGRA